MIPKRQPLIQRVRDLVARKPVPSSRGGMGIGEERIAASYRGEAPNWRLLGRSRAATAQIDQYEQAKRSVVLWQSNPFARQIVETTVHFVCGDGITVHAKNPVVQGVCDTFWDAPSNRLGQRQMELVRELALTGEVALGLKIDTKNGDVKLLPQTGENVREVTVNLTNPEEVRTIKTAGEKGVDVEWRRVFIDPVGGAGQNEILKPIYGNVQPVRLAGRRVGNMLYWAVNRAAGMVRGQSDLLPVLDALDVLDEIVMCMADRARISNYVLLKCKDRKASRQDLRRYADPADKDYVAPPEPLSILWENDEVEWSIMQANLQAADMNEALRTFLLPISAGAGQPIFFFGTGEETNRASALEMGSPVHKRMTTRQAYVVQCLQELMDFVVDQKRIFVPEMFEAGTDFTVTVAAPDIGTRDEGARANVLTSEMNAISAAATMGMDSAAVADLSRQAFVRAGFELTTTPSVMRQIADTLLSGTARD